MRSSRMPVWTQLPDVSIADCPAVFASPFDPSAPHPVAQRAAQLLQASLQCDAALHATLAQPGGGKMVGVLVVADRNGRVGFLCGFSGMLDGAWHREGFVPPLFDAAARDAMWPAGQAALRAIEVRWRELSSGAVVNHVREQLSAIDTTRAAASEALRTRHVHNRASRKAVREASACSPQTLHALEQQSRADTAERRSFDATIDPARDQLARQLRALDDERLALQTQRADESRGLMQQVHDTYAIVNARGERRRLRELFAPGEPPAGAGDCAGPKLFGYAFAHELRPLAMAEFWWGASPATGDRHHGRYYPSCRGKCGPIVPFMLEGLASEAAPVFGIATGIAADEPRAVFEDEWLVIVDKPVGLLSVPGRSGALRDCAQTRLAARYPGATGPMVVHRLDLDTSGLLLIAKDAATHTALQRLFARREIDKRYIAWLDGVVTLDSGTIELPLRVDIDDRPRQIVDAEHGKSALTQWRVVERTATRTKVELIPRTGRTHQLRVHASHPAGLGAAIVGDRLYGTASADQRLLLHAESIAFIHPQTGKRLDVSRVAPF